VAKIISLPCSEQSRLKKDWNFIKDLRWGEAAQPPSRRGAPRLRDGQQWPKARPKREALQGRANSELRNSPTRAERGAAPNKKRASFEKSWKNYFWWICLLGD